uniref:COesterase domain-containing protein n=1 Tax=Panagrellus redivivus TaxID=6233 RepID=A0A7E4VNM0_PANRE
MPRRKVVFLSVMIALSVYLGVLLFTGSVVATGPQVRTQIGILEGFTHENSDGSKVDVFLGVKYAQAGRFQKPMPYPEVTGVVKATTFGPSCWPQEVLPSRSNAAEGPEFAEDCLYLNIIKPSEKPKNPNGYPVLVYIHGGGFVRGDARDWGYKSLAEKFASKGIIVVTIQYRLGPFGFFASNTTDIPTNLGLFDQMYALFFLNQILPNFNGNPYELTVLGHSAGAAGAHALAISPQAGGLFTRIIQLSASLFSTWAIGEDVIAESLSLAERLGCPNNPKLRDCLEAKPVEAWMAAMKEVTYGRPSVAEFRFHPKLDDSFLPFSLEELSNDAPAVPILFGLTDAEWVQIVNEPYMDIRPMRVPDADRADFNKEKLLAYFDRILFKGPDDPLKPLIEEYIDSSGLETPNDYLKKASEIISDVMFNIPVINQIQHRIKSKQETYLFYETFANPDVRASDKASFGVPHGNELAYLFPAERSNEPFTKEDILVQDALIDAIVSFVKTGKPKSGNLSWPQVGSTLKHVLLTPDLKVNNEYEPARTKFWTKTLPSRLSLEALRKHLPFAQKYDTKTEL